MKLHLSQLCLWCLLISCGSLLLSCTDFATDERKNVHMVLKKDGKTYLFSSFGTFITKNSLNKNESPRIIKSITIVEKQDSIYTEPQHLKNIASLISGNYIIHDHPEKTIDGYITVGAHDIYDKEYVSEHTEEIGKMVSMVNIYLTDVDQTRKHHISWQRSPNQVPINNCTKMALWVDKSYKPGERTAAKEHFIMINLNDLADFFNPKIKLDYVEEEEILYIIVDSNE